MFQAPLLVDVHLSPVSLHMVFSLCVCTPLSSLQWPAPPQYELILTNDI